MKIKSIPLLVLIIFTLSLSLLLTACGGENPPGGITPCEVHSDPGCDGFCDECSIGVKIEHYDGSGDGKCDKCGRCISHRDLDCDAGCDTCLATVVIAHTDGDGDGKCDKCGRCTFHADGGCDAICDSCSATVKIEHGDRDEDGKCDKCGRCTVHADRDCDGGCDECLATVAIEHTDGDGDGKCDKCRRCTVHADGDCDGVCDICPASVEIIHIDEEKDGMCDKCKRCIRGEHIDDDCNGVCDRDGASVDIQHIDRGDGVCEKCERCTGIHVDYVADGACDNCGAEIVRGFSAKKTSSIGSGITLYPTHALAYSGKTYRGARIEYTISAKNTTGNALSLLITDTVPEGTAYVSGAEAANGDSLSWSLALLPGEEGSVSYTVEVITDASSAEGGYIESRGAAIDGDAIDFYERHYIERTLNEIDVSYIDTAIKVLAKSSWESFELVQFIYTVAFTQTKVISDNITGAPAEVLDDISSGVCDNGILLDMIAPGMFGGKDMPRSLQGVKGESAQRISPRDLISGDLLLAEWGGVTSLYIYGNGKLYDISKVCRAADTAAVLASLADADGFVLLRPSVALTTFTPSDPDEKPEELNGYQAALVATAEAFLLRGENMQYEDTYFGNASATGELRAQHGIKSPEDYTLTEPGYSNCASFTFDVYLNALGYTLPSDMWTTKNLESKSQAAGMRVDIEGYTGYAAGYTAEQMLQIEANYLATLEPGDIMVVRRLSGSGHAMLYIGNGKFIHSGGAVYDFSAERETPEPTIRYHRVHDYFFTEGAGGYLFYKDDAHAKEYGSSVSPVTSLFIVRPLNKFSGTIPEKTQNRMDNLSGIRVDKLSSHASGKTVNPGDEITFTFSIYNTAGTAKTVEISDKAPEYTVYLSGAERVREGELCWTVTVGREETVTVSYTVRVAGDAPYGAVIYGTDASVGGVSIKCPEIEVRRTLTVSEEEKLLVAYREMIDEGSLLLGLEFVNELYNRAFGIADIFATTNPDEVMRGEDGVFTESTVKIGGKYASELNTESVYYRNMLADGQYGGYRVYTKNNQNDRTRMLTEYNVAIGDILVRRMSSSTYIYLCIGEGVLVNLSVAERTEADFPLLCEKLLYCGRDYAILRPSMVITDEPVE